MNQTFMQPWPVGQMPMQPILRQPQQPIMQPIGIPGKFVNDFNEIRPEDIPGNAPAIFAKNDRSEIQICEWDNNGQFNITLYRAVVEETPTPVQTQSFDPSQILEPILMRITELEEKINSIPKPSAPRSKKEAESDGR